MGWAKDGTKNMEKDELTVEIGTTKTELRQRYTLTKLYEIIIFICRMITF